MTIAPYCTAWERDEQGSPMCYRTATRLSLDVDEGWVPRCDEHAQTYPGMPEYAIVEVLPS